MSDSTVTRPHAMPAGWYFDRRTFPGQIRVLGYGPDGEVVCDAQLDERLFDLFVAFGMFDKALTILEQLGTGALDPLPVTVPSWGVRDD